ncbi:outer membrane lipoprotein-sorting protein [Curtobacterium sp. PhB42]|uniref:LolA family protein n=1 Tax=unclassified Curtobacterium TaxID=257496 RepID=UPI001046E308|nr:MULTISPECIES: sigma-E factor regulatory protein RseB domain-containing protein [unclassified Curtobacterium]TCU85379.1 outer membrane lipoprotein-sorting protein [Curtobacterium sp. PhB191]TDW46897.1 outer membrane lipoprotein-sorting protein [Curtobacterium sp. PhB42]TDW57221.1 outer membrane lipoprotein-sorting protein [Curtobacterium sp. PhB190]
MKKSAWLPAVIAPVVVAGAVAAPMIANAANDPIAGTNPTAADVIASIAKSSDAQYSGKLSQSSDLGLPELPTGSGGSSLEGDASDVLGLLTSSHTARVYVDGADKQRVQLTEQLAEQDVVRNGSEVWTWDSKERTATHVTLPSDTAKDLQDGTTTPTDIAEQAIDAITPSTTVSKPTEVSVAGHDAWQITLTPKSSDTLVGTVRLAVDQQTGLPLRATIQAAGQDDPAVQVGFTSLDYGAPAARLFDFTPPSNAKVTEKDLSDAEHGAHAKGDHARTAHDGDEPTLTGEGWGTIAELPAGTVDQSSLGDEASGLLGQLTKAVDGGRAVQTSLVSVYLTDDGRVLAGAVPVSSLVAAAK